MSGAALGPAEAARRLLALRARSGTGFVWTLAGVDAGRRLLVELAPDGALDVAGSLGDPALDGDAIALGRRALAGAGAAAAGLHRLGPERVEAYLELQRPAAELVIVGAGHVAQPLAELGALLGMQVTVLDDRPEFATRERFPSAARVLRVDFSDPFADVPIHEGSHVVLVTRGHRYDYDALLRLLGAPPDAQPGYLGMIGSRRRVRATFAKLIEEGVEPERLRRVRAPLGLDLRAETPAEIAVAVAAEIVLLRRGAGGAGTGAPLRDVEGVLERFFGAERTPAGPEDD